MSQLACIASIGRVLERHGITWWVDSGTLLGLTREARILPWDHDIDLSCWMPDDGLEPGIFNDLRDLGYRVTSHRLRSEPFVLKMRSRERMPVEVKLWRPLGDWAWCPVKAPDPAPFVWRLVRLPIRMLWQHTSVLDRVRLPTMPIGAMRVPTQFIANLDALAIEGVSVPVPADATGYLSWRYGDWRVPERDWFYRRDDPAFVREWPAK